MNAAHWQIGRTSFIWLIVGYAAALPYHFAHLPPWLAGVALLSLGWQLQLVRQRWRHPGRWIRAALVLVCFGGVVLQYRTLYSLESLTALLVVAFTLKFLELHGRRDAALLVYLGIFISALSLLFEQDMGRFFYTLASLAPWLAALVALYSDRGLLPFRATARTAAALLLQSIPLMLVLFVILPRVGSLWSVPMERNAAVTGMSDTLSLGNVARLARSGELAFRVTFDGERPWPDDLYWRGVVLSRFDGETWRQDPALEHYGRSAMRQAGDRPAEWEQDIERVGRELEYSVILQPTRQNWLFALDTPTPVSSGPGLLPDYRLARRAPVNNRYEYRVRSWLDHQLAPGGLPDRLLQQALALPEGSNPETVRRAAQWHAEAGSDQVYIERVLAYFNRDFFYTLEPPPVGRHGVDDFLWRTRSGFCEHFASSFVVMMRAAGIPARIVAGYLGGEWHPDGYLVVRQYDAHAWAEIWREGDGWVRVDPTAAVAPERVLMSVQDLFGNDPAFMADSGFSLQRYRDIPWLNRLRLQLDALDYYWARWVIGYHQQQELFLLRLLGATDPWRIGLTLLGVGTAVALLLAALTLRGTRAPARDSVDAVYLRFCTRLARAGVERRQGESPRVFAERAARQLPHHSTTIHAVTTLYERLRYAGADESGIAVFRREVRAFRPRLRSG